MGTSVPAIAFPSVWVFLGAMNRSSTPAQSEASATDGPIVAVCGTINVDTFVGLTEFPAPGETVIGTRGVQGLGGKGANQAAASAHLGVETLLLSAVGPGADGTSSSAADPLADLALDELQAHGVDTTHVSRTDLPTGQAFIMNDQSGENIIIVTSGANETVSPLALRETLKGEGGVEKRIKVLLAQGELTPEHSAELPRLAEALPGARFVLNLAPVTTRDADLLAAANPLMVNEIEAADVTGLPRDTPFEQLVEALRSVAKSAVMTLGPKGAAVITQDEVRLVPSPPSPDVVDTTGAGDAFCGTFAAALAQGADMVEAVQLGAAAGSLATRKAGAAGSYATEAEVRALAKDFFSSAN